MSFKQFIEFQHKDVDLDRAQQFYEKYKKECEKKQAEIFFKEFSNEYWLKEKYHPQESYQVFLTQKSYVLWRFHEFVQEMKEGKYQGANFAIEHSEILKDHDYSVAPFFGFNKEARML